MMSLGLGLHKGDSLALSIGGETVFHFEIWDDRTIPQNPEIWLRPR